MAIFEVWIKTDKVGSEMSMEYEIADDDLQGMTTAEIDKELFDYAMQFMEYGYKRADQ